MTEAAVRGRIVFEESVPPLDSATIHVFLEDTTYADAAAIRLRSVVVPPVLGADGSIAFELPPVAVDDRVRCTVRVWVDMNADGRVSKGDYLSFESCPVLTRGYPREVTVRVQRVT